MELNKRDEDFLAAIERNWPDYNIAPGASPNMDCCGTEGIDQDHPDYEAYDESSFSWSSCDSCGSSLGGDRHKAHAIHKDAFGPNAKKPDDVHHIEICTDCIMWHANGELPPD